MVFEAARRFACRQIPQTQCLVPRAGQGVVTVAAQHHVRDEVRVTVEALLGHTILGVISRQFPYDESFVWKYYAQLMEKFVINAMWGRFWTDDGRNCGYLAFFKKVGHNLTSRRRQNHVRIFRVGCDLCNPPIVADEGAF